MKITLPDGTTMWQNADGSMVPYTGQDGLPVNVAGLGPVPANEASQYMGPNVPSGPGQQGSYDPNNPQPGQYVDAGGARIYWLGRDPNGKDQWSSPISAKQGLLTVNGRVIDLDTGQVMFDFSKGEGSSLSPNTAAQITANQRENELNRQLSREELAEQQRQFNERFHMDKAKFNTQFPLDEGQVTGYYKGAPTLGREQFGEGQRQFDVKTGIDYYTDLMQRASNPRNFMQSFFERRGFASPPGSERFGNTGGEKPWTIGTLQQFMPGFLQGLGAFGPSMSQYGYGAARGQAQAATQQTQAATQKTQQTQAAAAPAQSASSIAAALGARDARPSGVFAPFEQTLPNIGNVVNAPQVTVTPTTSTGAQQPSVSIPGGGWAPANATLANVQTNAAGGSTPVSLSDFILKQGSFNLAPYAKGGVIPEPVVGRGLVSGRPYTFGERGPEGVVPSHLLPDFLKQRGGTGSYETGGVIGYDDPSAFAPIDQTSPDDQAAYIQWLRQSYYPAISPDSEQRATAVYSPPPIETTIGSATAPAAPVDAAPIQQQQQYVQNVVAPSQINSPAPAPQTPTFLPQNGQTAAPQNPAAPTVREVSAPGTFGDFVGSGGRPMARPTFLPGEDTPLSALLADGYLPPFLSRLFAQREGIQSQGTNQPQRFDLPADVPLISELAWSQMAPSEQQAFVSYLSSYGITPEDYFAYMRSVGPQGPQTRLPTFGTSFYFQPQR